MQKLCELCRYRFMGLWGLAGHVFKLSSLNKTLADRVETYRDQRNHAQSTITDQRTQIIMLQEQIRRHTSELG